MAVGKTTSGTIPVRSSRKLRLEERLDGTGHHASHVGRVEDERARRSSAGPAEAARLRASVPAAP